MRVVLVHGCAHRSEPLPGNIGSAKHPRAIACVREGRDRSADRRTPEGRVVKKLATYDEMLFGTSKVATPKTHYNLKHIPVGENPGNRFAQSKLKCLVCERPCSSQLALDPGGESPSRQRVAELFQIADPG